jgi:hypothetical protein
MLSLSTNLVITKSQNQIAVFGLPFSPLSYEVTLTANTDTAILIPSGMDTAIFSFSAGATVSVSEGTLSQTNSLPTGSVTQTSARINPPVCAVTTKDDLGNQLYLHLISPNPNDMVIVGFYTDGNIT